MSAVSVPTASAQRRPSPFARLTATEARLFLREPAALIWGLLFPVVLLVIVGSVPGTRKPDKSLGGARFVDAYTPIMMSFVLAMLALNALPPILATYREKGVLRRLSTTPVRPWKLLAAQLTIQAAVAFTSIVLIVVISRSAFGVPLPHQVLGYLVALVLGAGGLLAIGLVLSAVAGTPRVANALGAITFFPMMFFAGLWLPRAEMPVALRDVSDATPLGATVQAVQDAVGGAWPHPLQLGVLAAYAVIFGAAAVKLFRWE